MAGKSKREGKRKLEPKLRFPEFRDSPAWDSKLLEDVCELQAGKFVSASDIAEIRQDALFPCYGGNGLRGYTKTYTHSGTYTLIGRQGALCGNVLQCDGQFHATEHALVVTPKDEIDDEWLYFALGLLNLNRYAIGQAQPGLSVQVLNKVALGVARDPPEQTKIAGCLSSLDELIGAESRKLEALQAHKKGLMQQLFPREGETLPCLRFPEFNDEPEWEENPLGTIVDFQSGGTPSKQNPAFWNGTFPWVSAKDMKRLFLDDAQDHITEAAVEDGAKLVPAGTVLMLTRGMMLLRDLPICVVTREMAFNQDVKAVRCKPGLTASFLPYLLLGYREQILDMVDVAGHGTGKLNTDELRTFTLAIPQPAEQERIAECLATLEAVVPRQSARLEALKTHKKGLMQQLFPSMEAAHA